MLSSILAANVAKTEGAYNLSKPSCSMRTCFENYEVAVIVTVFIVVLGVSRHRDSNLHDVETRDDKRNSHPGTSACGTCNRCNQFV